jgi:hypothetical protein
MPDTLKILRATQVSDGGGGTSTTWAPAGWDTFAEIPCSYEPVTIEFKTVIAGKIVSVQEYTVTFPTHDDMQNRIDVKTSDRLEVQARGNEPVKMFKIKSLKNYSGVVWEATAELEN